MTKPTTSQQKTPWKNPTPISLKAAPPSDARAKEALEAAWSQAEFGRLMDGWWAVPCLLGGWVF